MKGVYLIISIVYGLIFYGYIDTKFDLLYTLVAIGVYLTSNILYFYKKKNIVNFEFFFALAFFCACFLTYFIIKEGEGFAYFTFSSNPSSLVKGIALAMVGYHCYLCGLMSINTNCKSQEFNIDSLRMSRNAAFWSNIICILTFCIFMIFGGINVLHIYSGEASREGDYIGVLVYWVLVYSVAVFANFSSMNFNNSKGLIANLFSLDKLFIINTLIIAIFLLMSGFRSQAIQVILPLLICFGVFIKQIPARNVFLILICGMVLMMIIGMTRSGSEFESDLSYITYLRDFNAANSSLGFFIDEVERKGVTGGSNYIPQVLSIVPYLQSITSNIVDFDTFATPSSRYFTWNFDSGSGLGTNIIADIYYTFGFVGVVTLMFILGRMCTVLSTYKNKYYFLIYIIFTGNAIFSARVEFPYVLRMLAWGCLFLFAVDFLSKPKSKLYIHKKNEDSFDSLEFLS